jgi:hypothetical protein
MKKVIIHVRGGVAEVIYSPPEIEVEIIDFDNDFENNQTTKQPNNNETI